MDRPSPTSTSPSSVPQSLDFATADRASSPSSHAESCVNSQESPHLVSASFAEDAELERHPKGKRKRTAAKDKAILEAAYTANPKPDKAARLDLVSRVSLNEKEVQIWFQNRRQNDRRKSRPLSPQEVAALRYGSMQILSSDPLPYNPVNPAENIGTSPSQMVALPDPRTGTVSPAPSSSSGPSSFQAMEKGGSYTEREGSIALQASHTGPGSCGASPQRIETVEGPRVETQSFSSAAGYSSSHWHHGSSFSTPSTLDNPEGDDSFKLEPFPPSSSSSTASCARVPPASQSQVRLSLSLEGKAEVVSAEISPQRLPPPRPSVPSSVPDLPRVRRPSLQRSRSALPTITLPPISTLTGSLPPRMARGRSRDVHAWEFACDAENREDELTAHAANESNGSALAAITLLRSTNATGALLPSSSSKRNAPSGRVAPRSTASKRPKLSRASSSIGRLQTTFALDKQEAGPGSSAEEKEASKSRDRVKVSMLLSPSGNDSDKENWSPDEEGNPQQPPVHHHAHPPPATRAPANRKRLPDSAPGQNPRRTMGRVLEEQRGPAFLAPGSRANTAPVATRHRRGGKGTGTGDVEIFEDGESDGPRVPDEEVERFMRGEVSPSKKGDMDCVAGLLSLSQGNWR